MEDKKQKAVGNSRKMKLYQPEEILLERGEENTAVVQRVLARAPQIPMRIVEPGWEREAVTGDSADPFAAGKRRIFFTRQRSTFLNIVLPVRLGSSAAIIWS